MGTEEHYASEHLCPLNRSAIVGVHRNFPGVQSDILNLIFRLRLQKKKKKGRNQSKTICTQIFPVSINPFGVQKGKKAAGTLREIGLGKLNNKRNMVKLQKEQIDKKRQGQPLMTSWGVEPLSRGREATNT